MIAPLDSWTTSDKPPSERPHGGRAALDFKSAEQEILRRLDISQELAGHIEFTASEPNDDGWLACRAIGRDDASPSAAVNVASTNGARGKYTDKGSGETLTFWDLTVKAGMFSDWKTAREHYSRKTGVALPTKTDPKKSPESLQGQVSDSIEPALHDAMIEQFCAVCPPTVPASVKAAAPVICRWNKLRCIGFRAFRGPDLAGIILRRIDGQKFPAAGALHERKTHLVKGSKDGWVVIGDLKAASVVWMVEGVPDALSLYPHLPNGHCVVSNVCGASPGHGLPFDMFSGKAVYVVGDTDDAGEIGARKRATAAAVFADRVQIAKLPFKKTASHGKDIRDFFLDAGLFEHLLHLAEVEGERVEKSAGNENSTTSTTPGIANMIWIPSEGETVKAKDRGNFGTIVRANGLTCSVRFVNPDSGDVAEVEMPVDELEPTGSSKPSNRTPIIRFSAREMAAAYPNLDPTVIEGLLRIREILNIISVAKVGKSWLVYYILLCVATGRPIFDRFITTAGKVLLIDNELPPSLIPFRIKTVADALGLSPDEYMDRLDIWSLRHSPRSIYDLPAEFAGIPPETYTLMILDAKYKSLGEGADENSNADEARYFAEAGVLAELTGASLGLVHHSTKGGQADKRVVDVGAGGSSQARAADTHLIIREHETDGAFVLAAAVRSFAPVEPLGLRWEFPLWVPDDSVDVEKLKGRSPQEEKQGKQDAETDSAILDECQTWRSRPELKRIFGWGDTRINRSIRRLLDLNYLEQSKEDRRGNSTEVFRKTIHAR